MIYSKHEDKVQYRVCHPNRTREIPTVSLKCEVKHCSSTGTTIFISDSFEDIIDIAKEIGAKSIDGLEVNSSYIMSNMGFENPVADIRAWKTWFGVPYIRLEDI